MDERTKLTGKEYGAAQTLFAIVSMLSECKTILGPRARKAKRGTWRDLAMLPGKAQSVMDNLLMTVDAKKLGQIMQDLKHVRLYVRVEAPGIRTMPDKQYCYLDTRALNDLLNYLIQSECVLCDKSPAEARKCPYRRMIESALPHEVNARDSEHCKYSDLVLGFETIAE